MHGRSGEAYIGARESGGSQRSYQMTTVYLEHWKTGHVLTLVHGGVANPNDRCMPANSAWRTWEGTQAAGRILQNPL